MFNDEIEAIGLEFQSDHGKKLKTYRKMQVVLF